MQYIKKLHRRKWSSGGQLTIKMSPTFFHQRIIAANCLQWLSINLDSSKQHKGSTSCIWILSVHCFPLLEKKGKPTEQYLQLK